MAKKNKNHSTQKVLKIIDASNSSQTYDITSNTTNTNEGNKKKWFVCNCPKNKNVKTQRPRTWKSITNLYGDADTTEVWDTRKEKPKMLFKTNVRNKDRGKLKHLTQNNTANLSQEMSKSQRNKKSGRKSIISLYRKPKKKKHGPLTKITKLKMDENNSRSPVVKFQQKPKIVPLVNHYGTGDLCPAGACREAMEYYYNSQKGTGNIKEKKHDKQLIKPLDRKHKCKCKQETGNEIKLSQHEVDISKYENYTLRKDKIKKPFLKAKEDKKRVRINEGHGDQALPITTNKTKNVKCKCNVVSKILRHACKCKLDDEYTLQNVGDQTGEPFFEIKVDAENMHVLNPEEIKGNVKTYGRLQKKHDCICHSRTNRLNLDRGSICQKGICAKALKNKQTNFDCKCIIKNKIIECKDTTCDSKKIIKAKKKKEKNKFYQSPTYVEKNKPLFEVMLDPVNMNIINTNEIHDIFNKASIDEICPTGICNVAAGDKNITLNCKCIKKKIIPITTECTETTCKQSGNRKCKLSYLCSRVFSKSENWHGPDRKKNRHRHSKRIPYETNIKKENIKARSDTHRRNGLTINISREHKQRQRDIADKTIKDEHDITCKCYCECDDKVKIDDFHIDSKNDKKGKSSKCRKKEQHVVPENLTFQERIMYCLKTKRVRCERKLVQEEKEFKKKEKKIIKENRKIEKKLQKKLRKEAKQWNCLTKFVSGVVNVVMDTIKNIILSLFSIATNPIGSYVYARERTKDLPTTIKRLKSWIVRTWRNRSGKLSKTIKESQTMNVLADQIENTTFYDTVLANKGRTPAEKALYETKKRLRQKRMTKRHDEALYGCRHMLLTTMRKTPCLWFYYICPDMYPQCLSLRDFMNNFLSVIIYLLAFMCWTPCILSFEICRAFLCCFFCTH